MFKIITGAVCPRCNGVLTVDGTSEPSCLPCGYVQYERARLFIVPRYADGRRQRTPSRGRVAL